MGGWGYHIVPIGIALLFAIGTSVLSWSNTRTADLSPRFHWPDETTNHFFALRMARGESLAVQEPRNIDAGNFIHPRTANVRADGALVPGSYLGLPLWYGMVGRVAGERAMLFVTPILAALGLLAFAAIVRRLWNPGENIRMIRMPDPNAPNSATVAVVATILLVLHPSVWLFTATAMLPNVPFVALLLVGVAVVFRGSHPLQLPLITRGRDRREPPPLSEGGQGGVLRWFLGGFLIGLALTIRTHELVWVVAIIAAVATRFFWRPTPHHTPSQREGGKDFFSPPPIGRGSARGWGALFALIAGLILPFVPILILNAQLYGSPFITGYALLQDGGAAPTEFASSMLPSWLSALIAPFGWHPVEAFSRFWRYMVVPYPWFVGLALAGLITYALSHFRTKRRKVFGGQSRVAVGMTLSPPTPPPHIVGRGGTGGRGGIGTIVLTVWLVFYYGSWTIADPLVRETNVLTISYVRYWLPILVVLAPWAAAGLLAVVSRMPTRWRAHAIALVFLGIALTSFTKVVTDPSEGLLRQRQAIAEHRQRARAVIAATPPDAIIISHRMDKVFFPERAVVHVPIKIISPPLAEGELEGVVGGASVASERGRGTETDAFLRNLQALAGQSPVYWYTSGPIAIPGFTFESVGAMPFGEQLYRVE